MIDINTSGARLYMEGLDGSLRDLGAVPTISITVAADSFGHLAVQAASAVTAMAGMTVTLCQVDRLAALRHQAKRKGRPGWRSLRIPKQWRWRAGGSP